MIRSAILPICLAGCLSAAEFPVGSKVQEISLDDHGSAAVVLPEKAAATVVIFTSTQCPISNSYVDRMQALYRDYKEKPVQLIFVNANVTESFADIDAHLKAHRLTFKVLKDKNNVLADRFNAQMTPETFVLDRQGVLVYHGRIDDSQNPARIQQHSLRQALDAMLVGQSVPVPETRAFGCTIKRVKKTS